MKASKQKQIIEKWQKNKKSVIKMFTKKGDMVEFRFSVRYYYGRLILIFDKEIGKYSLVLTDYTFLRILKVYE